MSIRGYQAVIAGVCGVGTAVSLYENADGPVTPDLVVFAVAMGAVVGALLYALFRATTRRRGH
jgi:hypothetical protein